MIKQGSFEEAIREIAFYLGLPIKVNLSFVPKNYKPDYQDGFQSTALTKTHRRQGGGIVAQVSIPHYLPFYGSKELENFPIQIRISESCKESPKSFITVMAHELSHIVLNSLQHREKENEFYTDLTSMMLGFYEVVKTGRKDIRVEYLTNGTRTHTTTYGYLSDDNFNFAHKKIIGIVNAQLQSFYSLQKLQNLYEQKIADLKQDIVEFGVYLNRIGKKPPKKLNREDSYKIMLFYQSTHLDNYNLKIKEIEKSLIAVKKVLNMPFKYNTRSSSLLIQTSNQLSEIKLSADSILSEFKNDFDILIKNIDFLFKIKSKIVKLFSRMKVETVSKKTYSNKAKRYSYTRMGSE
jgi:hypothetical protein